MFTLYYIFNAGIDLSLIRTKLLSLFKTFIIDFIVFLTLISNVI